MDLTAWGAYLSIAAALIVAALLHYRYREPEGRGRRFLALLRGLALAGVVLLLFNPLVPAARSGSPAVLAVVDGSRSMAMPDTAGATAWTAAWGAVAAMDADRVMVVGDERLETARSGTTGLSDATPGRLHSRLGPALRAAAESGAERVVLVTDGAADDPAEVRRLLEGTPGVELRRVGGPRTFNGGLTRMEAPAWARTGDTVRVSVTVGRVGVGGPDTMAVALREGERELARRSVATPPPGREATVEIPFTAPRSAPAPIRLDAVLLDGGSVTDDDRRSAYLRVAESPAGVAVVSLAAGQEPRFLIPVLGRATGLPVRGWAAVTEGRWVRLGAGSEAGRVDEADAVRRAVDRADVVVLHGLGGDAPEWAAAAVGSADRVLVFPTDDAPGLPFDPGPAREADWYVTDAVPASPVAPLLAGAATSGLPPLTALRTPAVAEFWAPLMARAGRRGEALPVLLAGRDGERRVAVALGVGYWRWAFSGGDGRAVYERFWAAVAGWLVEAESAAPSAPASGSDSGSVSDGGEEAVSGYSAELTRPVVLETTGSGGEWGAGSRVVRRPLRSTPWGYLAVVVLLSMEWVLRRRWGLR